MPLEKHLTQTWSLPPGHLIIGSYACSRSDNSARCWAQLWGRRDGWAGISQSWERHLAFLDFMSRLEGGTSGQEGPMALAKAELRGRQLRENNNQGAEMGKPSVRIGRRNPKGMRKVATTRSLGGGLRRRAGCMGEGATRLCQQRRARGLSKSSRREYMWTAEPGRRTKEASLCQETDT